MIVAHQAAPDDSRPSAVGAEEHAESRVVVHLGEAAEIIVCRAHATLRAVAGLLAALEDVRGDESACERPDVRQGRGGRDGRSGPRGPSQWVAAVLFLVAVVLGALLLARTGLCQTAPTLALGSRGGLAPSPGSDAGRAPREFARPTSPLPTVSQRARR